MRVCSCCSENVRQLGKPWPTGRPSPRMERKSGGNVKLKVEEMVENSASVSPLAMGTLELLRLSMRFLA